jgi:hypothetical protein
MHWYSKILVMSPLFIRTFFHCLQVDFIRGGTSVYRLNRVLKLSLFFSHFKWYYKSFILGWIFWEINLF